MEFRTIHSFDATPNPIDYQHKILCVGSCFAANMGKQLEKYFFDTLSNPNGIIFNPISLVQGLKTALHPDKLEVEKHVFEYQNRFYSWLHHGSFQSHSKEELLNTIHEQNAQLGKFIKEADYILLTWGSAHVYTLNTTQEIVANCHKMPSQSFQKRLLSISEIVSYYQTFLTELLAINPKLKLIWSISPVKYVRDGLHQNNLSKSVLFLALEELLALYPST
ncbi:MAG: GSCFA domain-containing protein [Bacteroidia bacterium]|nr:GSCFA domain-containing protein [Bacteroidia bacterium]